jgi:hypothetical protein
MMELQMWSPSHTGGIVEGSIDAVLSQSTFLGPSQFLCDTNTAKTMQPHVNWFLRYLEETRTFSISPSLMPTVSIAPGRPAFISCQAIKKALSAKTMQPHVNWFLRYLEETRTLESEAPWVTLVFAERPFSPKSELPLYHRH